MKLFIFTLIILEILHGESKLEKEIKQKLISPCCWAGTIYDLDHNPEIELEIKKMELTVVRNEIQRLRKQSNKPLRVVK